MLKKGLCSMINAIYFLKRQTIGKIEIYSCILIFIEEKTKKTKKNYSFARKKKFKCFYLFSSKTHLTNDNYYIIISFVLPQF